MSISVTAAGTPPFTYQWKKDGGNIGTNVATYVITSASIADSGQYSVVVSNSAGSITSDIATLTIDTTPVAPSITTQPLSQSVTSFASVSFTVSASGSATLSYQWAKGGINIPGATTSTYTISSAQLSDAANYSVIVSNSAGSSTSNAATLTVSAFPVAPVITVQPQNLLVAQGTSASFSVVATGSATLSYQWTKGGINISGAIASTYTIASAQFTDANNYAVVVSNSAGSALPSNPAALTVNTLPVAPSITTQPLSSQTVIQGGAASFTIVATGTGPLGYQWRKNGISIPNALAATYSISSAQFIDTANYTVVVSNATGSLTSSTAALTVNAASVAPTITTQPQSQAVTMGTSVTFGVTASGTPPLGYQWKKNGTAIANALAATYTISSAQLSDAASYTVVVSNIGGSVTSSGASLAVNLFVARGTDFNTDSRTDIIFENTVTGDRAVWLMNSLTLISSNYLANVPPEWHIVGTGDFNGDGKTDILWENSITGIRAVWLMNGFTLISSVGLAYVPIEWHIAGTGDFNGDSKTDIIWQNTVTGDRAIWLMNGLTIISSNGIPNVLPIDWHIVGTGDFNGDGQTDIVWENVVTGDRAIWLMNGIANTSFVDLGVIPIDWHIVGTGDFNNDGKSDIVWQNTTTGDRAVWLMNGLTLISSNYIGNVPVDWSIVP